MKKSALGLLLFLVVAGGEPVWGQTRAGTVEVSVFGGWEAFDTQGIDDDFIYGLRAGWNITDHVGFEGYLDQVGSTDGPVSPVDIDVETYGLDFVWSNYTESDAHVPYLLLGLGRGETERNGMTTDFDFWEIGLGYRYFYNPNLAIRVDLRTLGTDGMGELGTGNFDTKGTVGVSIVFGR